MKIAILESTNKQINGHLKQFETVSYSSLDLLLAEFQNYNVIIIDKQFVSTDVIKLLKTHNIEIVVLNVGKIDFDVFYVSEIIDYSEIDSIKEKIQYIATKIKIKRLLQKEQEKIVTIKDFSKKINIANLYRKTN
jgi:hypothetical protein